MQTDETTVLTCPASNTTLVTCRYQSYVTPSFTYSRVFTEL